MAVQMPAGSQQDRHDWFNAKAASLLVEGSQSRISRPALVMDNEEEPAAAENGREASFEDDEAALRDAEVATDGNVDASEEEIMSTFATQTQTVRQRSEDDEDGDAAVGEEEEAETLQPVTVNAPPVFRPISFMTEEDLTATVQHRLRKGHEAILEEQPKWSLLAKVLKEIEDTIARVSESHAGQLVKKSCLWRVADSVQMPPVQIQS